MWVEGGGYVCSVFWVVRQLVVWGWSIGCGTDGLPGWHVDKRAEECGLLELSRLFSSSSYLANIRSLVN